MFVNNSPGIYTTSTFYIILVTAALSCTNVCVTGMYRIAFSSHILAINDEVHQVNVGHGLKFLKLPTLLWVYFSTSLFVWTSVMCPFQLSHFGAHASAQCKLAAGGYYKLIGQWPNAPHRTFPSVGTHQTYQILIMFYRGAWSLGT